MYELCLFAGAGGGLLATKHLLGWESVGYVEIEPYCQEVLKARIRDGLLDDAPIWNDVRTFTTRNNNCRAFIKAIRRCRPLVITAGFPCTPFSTAGQRKGATDRRNLWPDTIRIINEMRPDWCLLENSPDLRCCRRTKDKPTSTQAGYLGKVLGDLARSGFDARWSVLSAEALGANHRRRRLWVVAHARRQRCDKGRQHTVFEGQSLAVPFVADAIADANLQRELQQGDLFRQGRGRAGDCPEDVAHTAGERLSQRQGVLGTTKKVEGSCGDADGPGWWEQWPTEPALCGVDDGVAARVDRIKALGNGQVPAVVAAAWRLLSRQKQP